jgi:GNAT superfamily N-acetyltransferase
VVFSGPHPVKNVPVLLVRPAQADDDAEVAGVHIRAWQRGYRGLLPDDYLDGLRPEDRQGRYTFASPDPGAPSTLVAVEDGAIRGFVTTGPGRDAGVGAVGEVLALHGDPVAWGLGLGRRLVAEGRAQLDRGGFADAVVWVLAGNDRARRFYLLDGWTPDGARRTEEVWGVAVDEVRLHRRLP